MKHKDNKPEREVRRAAAMNVTTMLDKSSSRIVATGAAAVSWSPQNAGHSHPHTAR
jgi:hypothetical protein